MEGHRRTGPDLPSLDGKSVRIIGPRRFQNTLLSQYIAGATGATCRVHPDGLPGTDAGQDPAPLVLADWLERGAQETPELLARQSAGFQPATLLSLFNVRSDSGVEGPALRCGVRGFFYENDAPAVLARGIVAIFAGNLWVSRQTIAACLQESAQPRRRWAEPSAGLTPREAEIVRLLAFGETNEQIAGRMCISAHTVKTHLYNVYRKIDVRNRLQAVQWSTKHFV